MASIISAGTTDSTSLNVSGDKTGILQLASNNAVTAVTIDASQNVGIGTASPAAKLELGSGTLLLPNNVFIQQKDSSGNAKNVVGVAYDPCGVALNSRVRFTVAAGLLYSVISYEL